MDSPPYFYAGLDRLFFKRDLYIRLFGKLLCSSRVTFADQVVHDDEIDVPTRHLAELLRANMVGATMVGYAMHLTVLALSEIQVNMFSTRGFGEIPNLSLRHHVEGRSRRGSRASHLRLRRLHVIDPPLESMLGRCRNRCGYGGGTLHCDQCEQGAEASALATHHNAARRSRPHPTSISGIRVLPRPGSRVRGAVKSLLRGVRGCWRSEETELPTSSTWQTRKLAHALKYAKRDYKRERLSSSCSAGTRRLELAFLFVSLAPNYWDLCLMR
jgi:hypothetical protein